MTLQQAEVEVGAFKTPTLRNISRTAPYMHNGVYGDLWDVVDHYNFGGATGSFAGTKEVTIAPLLLNDREMGDLVEFLRSLEDGPPKVSAEFPEGLTAPPALP
jgi:cytochrome c peroxidase